MVEERLIDQAIRGDRAARAALLRQMQDRWFRFAVSQLSSVDLAEDAVQESAMRVLTSLGKFDRRSTFSTWSLGIVLNVCREMRRKRVSLRLDDSPEPSAEHAHPIEQNDAVARLREALSELPERQREALALRFFEELSVEQTAGTMKCAEGTVKATVHQALKALREKLKSLR